MRRFLKISAVALLLFLTLLIISALLLRYYFPNDRIKALVIAEGEKATGRKVSVGDLEVSFFHGIDIREIYIGENSSYGDVPFIRISRINVGYDLSEIFRRNIVLNRILIERPELYVRSRNGELAFSDLINKPTAEKKPPAEEKPSKPAKPLPVTLLLQRCEVQGISLNYEAEDLKGSIRGIDLTIDGDLYPFKRINVKVLSGDENNVEISAQDLTVNTGLFTDLIFALKETNTFSLHGNVALKGINAGMKEKKLSSFDIGLGLDLAGDVNVGAEIMGISVAVGKGSRFELSGLIREIKGLKGVALKASGRLDLAEISGISAQFIPVPVSGAIEDIGVEISGDGPGSLTMKSNVSLKNIQASHKGLKGLVNGSIQAEADSKGDMALSGMRLNFNNAVTVVASANANNWGKGKISGRAHVVADNAKSLAIMPEEMLKKIGKVAVSGTTEIDITGERASEKGPLKVNITGVSDAKNISAGPITVDETAVNLSIISDDLLIGKVAADARVKVKGIKVKQGEIELNEDRLDAAVSAYGDIKKGDISLNILEIAVPGLMRFFADGDINGWGKVLALNARVDDINHKRLMERVPLSLIKKIPKVEVEGKSSVAATVTGAEPLKIAGTFKTEGLGVSLPDNGISVKNSDGRIEFDISKSVQSVSGSLKVGSFQKNDLMDKPVAIFTEIDLTADGPDMVIKKVSAAVPEKNVSFLVSGGVAGYMKEPKISLDMAVSFDSGEKVDLLKGITASGGLFFNGEIRSPNEKELVLNGGVRFDHLHISYQDRGHVNDLNGEIRIEQGARYAKGIELLSEEAEDGPYATLLYDLMRPYIKKGYDLTMGSASFDSYEAGPLNMDIAWRNGRILIDRYELAVFGGGITGSMHAEYDKGTPRYSVVSNIAGIRFDRIFKGSEGKEDVEVNADLNLRGKGTDIEGQINVTRIGKDTLNRALLGVDPTESNPQIVDIRSKLNTLGWVPKEVAIWIRHGELNLDVTMQRREFTLLNIVGLEKIPVRRVPVGYLIKKGLKMGIQ